MSAVAFLHRGERIVAVSKPSGIHVHRTALSPDRDVLLVRVRDALGRHVWPVHRLDRATSGIVLFALDPEAAAGVQTALAAESAEKVYIALVRGAFPAAATSDRPLTRRSDGTVQEACTEFRLRESAGGFSLVEARPRTGRRHQIRRHLAHLAHQVAGDTTYGKGRINARLRAEHGLGRLFLHATAIAIDDPSTGERLCIEDPLPEELARVWESVRRSDRGDGG